MIAKDHTTPANTQKQYEVTRDDLPLSCPMPDMVLWNAHPKIYLPIEETGKAICPYCSAIYILTDWQPEAEVSVYF